MENEREVIDVYDVERQKTGKTAVRSRGLRQGEYRVVVHVCIFNSEGKLLIQKRTKTKRGWPGLWDVSVGGGAVAGDTSARAAERETLEEIGLAVDFSRERPRITVNFRNGFNDVYIIHRDLEISELVLEEDEVECCAWATREEVLRLLEKKEFIPYYKGFIDWIFEAASEEDIFSTRKKGAR